MFELKRTNAGDVDFVSLVKLLDADLLIRDGDEHSFYAPFNTLDEIKYIVVAYQDAKPVGCGAIKDYGPGVMEVKRMFVCPEVRGHGFASRILEELESWACELECTRCMLETGFKQPEAIGLYTKCGYERIENYGQYKHSGGSVCFEKVIGK